MSLVLRSSLNRPLNVAEIDGNFLHLLDLIESLQGILEKRESFVVDSNNYSRDRFSVLLEFEPINADVADVYVDGVLTTNYTIEEFRLDVFDDKSLLAIGNTVVIKYKYNGVSI